MNYYNYFTEIEEHFVKRRGKHLLVSPMDWNLIAIWRETGIPLQVALRGIDIAMDSFFARRDRANSKLNTLCYCHDSVMEEYARYQESRVGESQGEESSETENVESERTEILKVLSQRINEIKTLPAKQYFGESVGGIHRALARLEEIMQSLEADSRVDSEALERDLGIAEEILMEQLRAAISAEQMAEWEKESKSELKIYKKRLPKETYERIHRNFLNGRIRQHFQIGELSIFHL
jgi:hypothetical protein